MVSSRTEMTKERINKFEDQSIKVIQSEQQKENTLKIKNEQSFRDIDTIRKI